MNDEVRIVRGVRGGPLRYLSIRISFVARHPSFVIVDRLSVTRTAKTGNMPFAPQSPRPDWLWMSALPHSSFSHDHFSPLNSNSAFVFVACKFEISVSIASIGGSAAIVLRNTCTRSHSSG